MIQSEVDSHYMHTVSVVDSHDIYPYPQLYIFSNFSNIKHIFKSNSHLECLFIGQGIKLKIGLKCIYPSVIWASSGLSPCKKKSLDSNPVK